MRTVEDGDNSIQPCSDSASGAFDQFASERSNQAFNGRPTYVCSRRLGEYGPESGLLCLVHLQPGFPQ
jgi:hypothetical protein